jgi:molybdopterin-binding protein
VCGSGCNSHEISSQEQRGCCYRKRILTLSARNQLQGKITEISLGEIMAHVVVRIGKNLVESVITRRSAEEMQLKKGDTVTVVVKSTEVMISKG